MKDLKVGDQVLTSQGDGQPDKYQPVYAFGHIDPNALATFVRIYTKDTADTPLELTAEHMVYVYGKTRPIRSDSIQVGDILRGHNGSASTVTKISTIKRSGLYNPLTPSGTIVVGGIAASAYNDLEKYVASQGGSMAALYANQDFMHLALSPFRLLCMGFLPIWVFVLPMMKLAGLLMWPLEGI
jgi:hypothetical protein